MRWHSIWMAFAVLALTLPIRADETVDEAMVARFKVEGFQHSRVMETLTELTDTFGGRLRGSPSYATATDWAKQRLNEFGVERVAFEPGGFPGPGWTLKRFSVEMTAPQYLNVIALPMAWSPATAGRLSATPVLVEVSSPADFDRYRGKLRGAIVLNGKPRSEPATNFAARRGALQRREARRRRSRNGPDQAHPRQQRRP